MSLARDTALELHGNLIKGDRQSQVMDFHDLYDLGIYSAKPDEKMSHMSDELIGLRLGLNLEETKELFLDGFGIDLHTRFLVNGQEYDDLILALRASDLRDTIGAADALGDISYVTDGFALEIGVDLDAVVDEIHASNMTKSGLDGKPVLREDGKILKGPKYVKPDLSFVTKE